MQFLGAKLLFEPVCPSLSHRLTHSVCQGCNRFLLFGSKTQLCTENMIKNWSCIECRLLSKTFLFLISTVSLFILHISVCLIECIFVRCLICQLLRPHGQFFPSKQRRLHLFRNGEYSDLDTLLRSSDFITIHVPLLPQTQHLIDQVRICTGGLEYERRRQRVR